MGDAFLQGVVDQLRDECAEHSDVAGKLRAANAELIEALKIAANEFNAIRARDGAPQHIDWHQGRPLQTDSVTHEAWDEWTELFFTLIAKHAPTPETGPETDNDGSN